MKDQVVAELSNLFEEHMNLPQEGDEIMEATRIPYMEGDYWPGVAEDIIGELDKEERKDRGGKAATIIGILKSVKKPMKNSGAIFFC